MFIRPGSTRVLPAREGEPDTGRGGSAEGEAVPDRAPAMGADDRWRHWMLAAVLLTLDLLFLLGNVVHLASNDPDEPVTRFSAVQWNGNYDGTFVEMFGHTQLVGGAVMLVFLAVIRRSPSFVVWTGVLVVLVADDFFQIHESVGADLVRRHGLPAVAGLRPQDLGELLVWAVLALVLGSALLISYFFSSRADRRHSRALFGWLCLLAVFAVVIDQLHVILEPHVSHTVSLALTLTETTGELVGMTLIVLAIHRIALRTRRPAA
jgi:hypothetical protein